MAKKKIEKREITHVDTSPATGLTTAQVEERLAAGHVNTPVDSHSKSVGAIIASNLFTYFNLIFTILAVLLIIAGCFKDLSFVPIIVFNALIGIIQELRSKATLDKLTVLNAPTARVIRNGNEEEIDSTLLVTDDIIVFKAGDQIPADAIVVEGKVSANEALLTGEADEIQKEPGAELMSGSFIVSGSCKARITAVGEDSYISQLTLQAKQQKHGEQSEMIRSLNKIVKLAGIIIIPIGGLLFFQSFMVNGDTFQDSIRSTVASVIGMIPEGLFLLASITLVLSTVRLANHKVMVHDMKCIETLARVNVLCVDKTGTITENTMKVTNYIPVNPDGSSTDDDENIEARKKVLFGLLSDFAAAQSADNITMAALKQFFTTPTDAKIVGHTDFSSEFKYSSVSLEKASYVLGAPEFVLRENYNSQREEIELHSRRGYRVLAFAEYKGTPDGKALTAECVPLGLVLITNPIRSTAPATFDFFYREGVDVKVISGDNPITVSEVAKQAGVHNAEKYVDASTLTTDDSISKAIMTYTVFGRVTPDQKRKFVKALQAHGRTVAMTGDGVNDILALKDADCSVAMASGSEAAVQAAQLVLLDSDFAHMPQVVMEGRQVVNNMERSGSLFLVKNIFSLILSVFAIYFGITYPLTPSQITLISAFTIGLPAFLLSQVPDHFMIQGKFMKNVILRALPGALTDVLIVIAMVYFGQVFGVSSSEIATSSTYLVCIVGVMILIKVSRPHTNYKRAVIFLCVAGLFASIQILPSLFGTVSLSYKSVLLCINFGIMADALMHFITFALHSIEMLILKFGKNEDHARPIIKM